MKIRTYLTFIAMLFGLAACQPGFHSAQSPVTPDADFFTAGIFGGKAASLKDDGSRSVVMITGSASEGHSYICTGTLISENWILTAGHCLSPDKDFMSVFFDLNPLSSASDVESPEILEIRQHPDFKSQGQRNDLGLIRIKSRPKASRILPLSEAGTSSEASFRVLGYGRSQATSSNDVTDLAGAGLLRTVSLPARKLSLTSDLWEVDQSKNSQGVCFGDSGGPALRKSSNGQWVLAAVASGVTSPDTELSCLHTSLFTDVSKHLAWIRSQIL